PDLVIPQNSVKTRPLNVQDLTAQRQNRLRPPVTARFRGTAGRVTLDDEDFGFARVPFLTIGQLAGQVGNIHDPLAARHLPRLTRGFAGAARIDDLGDDNLRVLRVFLQPRAQRLVNRGAY